MCRGTSRIVFIVGNSRSGTTMLGRVLGLNSKIYTFGELHFFEQLVGAEGLKKSSSWDDKRLLLLLERLLTSSRDGFFANISAGKYTSEAASILAKASSKNPLGVYNEFLFYEAARCGKVIPCEQTPRYLFFLDEILDAFTDVRVINLIRDPRDVLISQKNKWRRRFLGAKNIPIYEAMRTWANYHPYLISKLWVSCIKQAMRFQADPRVMSIRFEDLLCNPERMIRKISDFVGVSYEPIMLRVPQVGSSTGVDKYEHYGINAARAGSWRRGGLSKTEISICEWVAAREMSGLGYDLSGAGRFELRLLPSMAQLFIKLGLILPMNIRRTRNIIDTLRRRLNIRY